MLSHTSENTCVQEVQCRNNTDGAALKCFLVNVLQHERQENTQSCPNCLHSKMWNTQSLIVFVVVVSSITSTLNSCGLKVGQTGTWSGVARSARARHLGTCHSAHTRRLSGYVTADLRLSAAQWCYSTAVLPCSCDTLLMFLTVFIVYKPHQSASPSSPRARLVYYEAGAAEGAESSIKELIRLFVPVFVQWWRV